MNAKNAAAFAGNCKLLKFGNIDITWIAFIMPQRKLSEADNTMLIPETLAVNALAVPEAVEVKLAILACDYFDANCLGIN